MTPIGKYLRQAVSLAEDSLTIHHATERLPATEFVAIIAPILDWLLLLAAIWLMVRMLKWFGDVALNAIAAVRRFNAAVRTWFRDRRP